MGGTPVSREVLEAFETTYLKIKSNNPEQEPIAKEVLDIVEQYFKQQKKYMIVLPKLRKSQQIVSNIRFKYSARAYEEKIKDKPWTLGACLKYPEFFPAGSLNMLVKHRKEEMRFVNIFGDSSEQHEPFRFSIRKAMWMVRLHSIILEIFKPSNFEEEHEILFNVSEAYSIAELRSITLGEETFDTTNLDKALYSQNMKDIFIYGCVGTVITSKKGGKNERTHKKKG